MGSKTVRQVPDVLLRWLEKNVSPEFADWYARQARSGDRQVTGERQKMSRDAGTTGAYHSGHYKGAMDVDPKLGGGPTSGMSQKPEIGAVNVAHKEAPRIPFDDMQKAGIPQHWIEDVTETILYSEGHGVIGNFDTKAALDIDAGDVTPGQAMAQTDRRDQLRKQGVRQVGPDTSVKLEPFKGEIKFKDPNNLPDLKQGLEDAIEKEKKQIANRRSTKANVKPKLKPEPVALRALRKKAALAAGAGLAGISILGTGASAAETATRTQIANETGDWLDKTQAGISGVSLTADVASYSGVGAIPGAIISSAADATNMIIDQFRIGANNQRIRGRSGAKRAQEALQ